MRNKKKYIQSRRFNFIQMEITEFQAPNQEV